MMGFLSVAVSNAIASDTGGRRIHESCSLCDRAFQQGVTLQI